MFQIIETKAGWLNNETASFESAADLWAECERQGVPAKVIKHHNAHRREDVTPRICLTVLARYRTRGVGSDAPDWLLDAVDRLAAN